MKTPLSLLPDLKTLAARLTSALNHGGVAGPVKVRKRKFQTHARRRKNYLHFRWLGERPDWTTREKTLWRYEHLHATAKRLGLI